MFTTIIVTFPMENEKINEKISVITVFNQETGLVMPKKIHWRNRDYLIKNLAYYHRVHQGKKIIHVFNVTDGNLDFRLSLDGENLHWTLEEIYDRSND